MYKNLDLQLRNIKYENKLKYYKKYYNSNKINKYLYKLNIKQFQTILNDMIGGAMDEKPVSNTTATAMERPIIDIKTQESTDYNLTYDTNTYCFEFLLDLVGGKNGKIGLYYCKDSSDTTVKNGFYIKKEVTDNQEYINEKRVFYVYNDGFNNIKCKLKMFQDNSSGVGGILIYQYLGIDLSSFKKLITLDVPMTQNIMCDIIDEMQASFKDNDKYIVHVDIKLDNICIIFKDDIQIICINHKVYLLNNTQGNRLEEYNLGIDIYDIIDEKIEKGFSACLIDYGNYISNHNKVQNTLQSAIPSILTGICEFRMLDITNNYIFIIAQYWSLLFTMLDMLIGETVYDIFHTSFALFSSKISSKNELVENIKNISQENFLKIITDECERYINSFRRSIARINITKLIEFVKFMLKNHHCFENEIKISEYNLENVKRMIMTLN